MARTRELVTIYTDGGCEPNPGAGGWAAILRYRGSVKEISGGAVNTTNNRMELTAAVEALKALRRPCRVVIYTDSQYLQNGISSWIKRWKRNGWKSRGGPVKNRDLWEQLDELAEIHDIEWRWVRGHAGDPLNERCDRLAAEAIAKFRKKTPLGAVDEDLN